MAGRKDLALRSIRKKFEEWRSNRRSGEEIPAALWDEVHALEGRFGRTSLAKELGVNSSEMAFQMRLRGGSPGGLGVPTEPLSPSAPASAPGALTSSQTVAITKVVSVPFAPEGSLASVVAEVESPSGWILRLHSEAASGIVTSFVEATSRLGGRP